MSDYFPRAEFRRLGLSEPAIRVLEKVALLADTISSLGTTDAALATVTDDLTDASNTIDTLDNRLDIVEAFTNSDARYVRQDQGAVWTAATGTASRGALASYAAPTISAAYVQAEVQNVANAAQAASQALVALITDLKANGALT